MENRKAQREFDEICRHYIRVSNEVADKQREGTILGSQVKEVLSFVKRPSKLIEVGKSVVRILENGGTNHFSEMYREKEMFSILEKYSIEQLNVLRGVALQNIKSHREMLYDLPVGGCKLNCVSA